MFFGKLYIPSVFLCEKIQVLKKYTFNKLISIFNSHKRKIK